MALECTAPWGDPGSGKKLFVNCAQSSHVQGLTTGSIPGNPNKATHGSEGQGEKKQQKVPGKICAASMSHSCHPESRYRQSTIAKEREREKELLAKHMLLHKTQRVARSNRKWQHVSRIKLWAQTNKRPPSPTAVDVYIAAVQHRSCACARPKYPTHSVRRPRCTAWFCPITRQR